MYFDEIREMKKRSIDTQDEKNPKRHNTYDSKDLMLLLPCDPKNLVTGLMPSNPVFEMP